MFRFLKRSTIGLTGFALAGLVFTGCGKDTNINQIFKVSGEDKRVSSLLALGRIHYDRGEHDEAHGYAKEAYEINKMNEDAAILYSYVLLGQAGMDPFSMTKKLIEASAAKTAAKSTALLATSAADSLAEFADLINISETDLQNMGTETAYSDTDSAFFNSEAGEADGYYDVFIPKKPGETGGPRESISTVNKVVTAIGVICPFVHADARVDDYLLHDCQGADGEMKNQARSNFVWSLAHLVEALAFNTALVYTGTASGETSLRLAETSSSTPNTGLFRRVTQLTAKSKDISSDLSLIGDYVAAVAELKDNVTAVFDTSTEGMLFSTLADLTAVSKGFASIAGLPTSVKDKIDKGLETIKTLAEKISPENSETLDTQSDALQQQMNKALSGKLKESIAEFNGTYTEDALNELSPDDKQEFLDNKETVCATYKDISNFSDSNPGTGLPTGC